MRCPTLSELPPPRLDRTGWPWTEGSCRLHTTLPNGQPWPRITVVTPSYNQGRFVEETIRSVLLQGYPNLEYIVVDGGSTDGSVDIVQDYEDHLTYWVSEPDSGQSDAINKGWARATGDILAWLNSDDVYARGALSRAATFLSGHPDVGAVYGDSQYIDEVGNPLYMHPARPFDYLAMLGKGFIPQPSSFVRRSVIDHTGALDVGLQYSLDFDLWMRVGLVTQVAYVRETLSWFRVQPRMKGLTLRSRKARELVFIHQRLFSRGDLPSEVSARRRRVMGRVHLYAAQLLLLDKRLLRSAMEMAQSFLQHPTSVQWYHAAIHAPLDLVRVLLPPDLKGSLRRVLRGTQE